MKSATATIRSGTAILFVLSALASHPPQLKAEGELPGDTTSSLYQMPTNSVETRWFTFENPLGLKGQAGQARFGRKGAPATGIGSGMSLVLAEIQGGGTIRRIWGTLFHRTPAALRGLKVEMYWDGANTPAVQAPIGDFFCHSLGHMVTFENACFYSPEGRSFNCLVPMPFHKSAKIVVVNESGQDNGLYYLLPA